MALVIALTIFIASLIGIGVLLRRNRSRMRHMAHQYGGDIFDDDRDAEHRFWHRVAGQPGRVPLALEKTLRRIRLWALRFERTITHWIEGLRRRSDGGNNQKSDDPTYRTDDESSSDDATMVSVVQKTPVVATIAREISKEQEEKKDDRDDDDASDVAALPPEAHRREQELIAKIADDPRLITAYRDLGFLYLRHNLQEYARETLAVAVKLGSQDKKIKETLARLQKEDSPE